MTYMYYRNFLSQCIYKYNYKETKNENRFTNNTLDSGYNNT